MTENEVDTGTVTIETGTNPDQISEILNDLTDAVREQLGKAEKTLADLDLGVRGWVPITKPEDGWVTWLVFSRTSKTKTWRLVLVSVVGPLNSENINKQEATLVLNASRSLRMKAAAKLPELLDMMTTQSNQEITLAKAALDGIQAFNKKMKGLDWECKP